MKLSVVTVFAIVLFNYFIVPKHCTNQGKLVKRKYQKRRVTYWNDERKAELLRIFYNTRTDGIKHSDRIKEQWDIRHPTMNNHTAHNLFNRAQAWILKGEAEQLLTDEEKKKYNMKPFRKNMRWTEEMNNYLLYINSRIHPKHPYRTNKIKELWDEKYPEFSHIPISNLMMQVKYWSSRRGQEIEKKNHRWTKEQNEDLLRFYHITNNPKDTRKLFVKKYPELAYYNANSLGKRLGHLRRTDLELNKKILREFQSNIIDQSLQPGETSALRGEKSPYSPKDRDDDSYRESDQYLNPNHEHSLINMNNQIIQSSFTRDYLSSGSWQHHSNKDQRESPRPDKSALDLDLHLR